jgi:hypothetical protein
MVLPHCISELPNSDPEIRSIKYYKSRLVEGVIHIRIVKTQLILRLHRPSALRRGMDGVCHNATG